MFYLCKVKLKPVLIFFFILCLSSFIFAQDYKLKTYVITEDDEIKYNDNTIFRYETIDKEHKALYIRDDKYFIYAVNEPVIYSKKTKEEEPKKQIPLEIELSYPDIKEEATTSSKKNEKRVKKEDYPSNQALQENEPITNDEDGEEQDIPDEEESEDGSEAPDEDGEESGDGSKTPLTYTIINKTSSKYTDLNTNGTASTKNYSLEYDENGNLIKGINNYYEYNDFNQLARVKENNSTGRIIAEYFYDHTGDRIKKVEYIEDGSNTTTYYIDANFVRVVNNSGTFDSVYYYHNSNLVGKKDSDGTKYSYHPDHLGSTNLVTNESGEIVEKTNYLPFGGVLAGGESRYLFTGQEKDKETNLMYYGARYYNPFIRHFTQPDSMLPDIYDTQQLNRYSYARNNPVKYVDETGNWVHIPIGALIGTGFNLIGQILFDGGSIFEGTIDWKEASAWGIGGGTFAATFGLGPAVAGTGYGGYALGGGIAGFTAGRSTQLSYNLMQETNTWNQDLLNVGDIGIETGAGAGLGVIGKGIGNLIGSPKTIGYRNIAGKTRKIENIKISQLRPSQELSLKRIDPDNIDFLKSSMSKKGFDLKWSVPYTKVGNIDYAIPQGHHRSIARASLGYKTVPAFRISNAGVGSFRRHPNAFFKSLPKYKDQRIDDYAKNFK